MTQHPPGLRESRIERDWSIAENSLELQQEGITTKRSGTYDFTARIAGPVGTPYEGGTFELSLEYPPRYPFRPPKVKFTTPLWHPNVCVRTGFVRTDVFQSWTPALTLQKVLISMRAFLSTPEPRNWINYVAARQYVAQRGTFEATAKFWAQYFAQAPHEKDRGMSKKVLDVEKMGSSRADAIIELSNAGWDVEQATEMLFS